MNAIKNKTVLITGATSGIGYELCKLFAEDKYNLVLVARNKDRLLELANELESKNSVEVYIISKDLAVPSSPEEIFNELKSQSISIDVLVNNAGFGAFGLFNELDTNEQIKMIQVNVFALTYLTKLFIENLSINNGGKILNIASTASFQPIPLMSVYAATKAYVFSFSSSLREEVKDKKISVTVLCPGPTSTNFEKAAKMQKSKLFNRNVMDPKTVAAIGYNGLMKGKPIVVPGLINKMLVFGTRFLPAGITAKIAKSWVAEK